MSASISTVDTNGVQQQQQQQQQTKQEDSLQQPQTQTQSQSQSQSEGYTQSAPTTLATAYTSSSPPSPAYPSHGMPTTSFTPVPVSKPTESSQAPDSPSGPVSNANGNPRQRSSIACLHCRRSKIRCVNEGIDTQCNACRNSRRECRYSLEMSKRGRVGEEDAERTSKRIKNRKSEAPAAAPAFVVPTAAAPTSLTEDGAKGVKSEMRSNDKLAEDQIPKDGTPLLVEEGILDPTMLTPQVWSELFELFETHYGTDLPFLHSPTFSKRLRESPDLHPSKSGANEPPKKRYDASKLPGWEMLVLGILALTARFHPTVVARLCATENGEKSQDPVHASEHYATVLRAILVGSRGTYIGQPNLAKIQALLMLGLYEWGICNGVKAWIHVGLAIRMAQAMGLQFEDDQDFAPLALSSATRIEALHIDIGGPESSNEPLDPASNDAFIEEEMRRRTFWSCFVMDRYLSSGKFRPSMLMLDDIKLQLPSSQNAFLFGGRVCTSLLDGHCSGTGSRTEQKAAQFRQWQHQQTNSDQSQTRERQPEESNDVQISCEYGHSEGVLSIHMRMVEIWGRIAKWTCAGGIRNERFAPWDERSTFHQLNESLKRFQNTLPRLYKLSKMNIEAHIAQHTSSPYILLQVLYSFCVIVLHRELVPFVPVRCNSPQGPLDHHPPWSEGYTPPSFYLNSARHLFKAAREIVDLIQTCQSRCPLPETPVMGFGLYAVAFVEIYALNFPHMDPDNSVLGRLKTPNSPSGNVKAASQMLEIIGHMRPRLPMANNWFRTIHRVHCYYKTIISEHGNAHHAPNMLPNHHDVRAALSENLALLELTLKEFGSIEDEDTNSWTQSPSYGSTQNRTPAVTTGREPDRADNHRISDSWTAVNTSEVHRPASSGLRLPEPVPRTEYQRYATSPSHTSHVSDASSAPHPPELSRGTTPTPSAASASPYQGPSGANNQEIENGGYTGQLSIQQQLTNHASQHPATVAPYPAQTLGPTLPPLTSIHRHISERPQIKIESSAAHDRNPPWMTDLTKSLGGDDVAAFMDGLSCQEWAEAVAARAAVGFRSIGGAGTGAGGSRDGWLTSVWRGTVTGVIT